MTACEHLLSSVEWQGVVYERFCGAEPTQKFTSGHRCAQHRPSVVFRGVVDPTPDPAMTAAAIRSRATDPWPARDYGLPAEPAGFQVRSVRVLTEHRKAVQEVMESAATIITLGGMDEFVSTMAQQVLSAYDHKPEYVVGVRVPGAHPLIYGPYATEDAAQKAIDEGHIPAYVEGQQAWVFQLEPAPKAPRKKRAAKKKTAEEPDTTDQA